MGFAKVTKIAFAAIAVVTILTSSASAQFFQTPFRWLGEGFSAGYHRCNPGPDTDYYNPWNAHNSRLISNLPQFQQHQSFQSFNLDNLESRPVYQGVPFSVYAAPRGHHQGGFGHQGFPGTYDQGSFQSDFQPVEGDMVESTFEPYDEDEQQLEQADETEDEEFEEEDFEDWQDEENEWMDDEIEDVEEFEEDDSARLRNSAPGQSVFSNAGFSNQNYSAPTLEGNGHGQLNQQPSQQLINPFPGQ